MGAPPMHSEIANTTVQKKPRSWINLEGESIQSTKSSQLAMHPMRVKLAR